MTLTSDTMDESTFSRLSSRVMEDVRRTLDTFDPDVVEATMEADVLRIDTGSGGIPFVLNKQRPVREVWLAAERKAWHFRYDGARWICKKTGDELFSTLSSLLTARAGVQVAIHPSPQPSLA